MKTFGVEEQQAAEDGFQATHTSLGSCQEYRELSLESVMQSLYNPVLTPSDFCLRVWRMIWHDYSIFGMTKNYRDKWCIFHRDRLFLTMVSKHNGLLFTRPNSINF